MKAMVSSRLCYFSTTQHLSLKRLHVQASCNKKRVLLTESVDNRFGEKHPLFFLFRRITTISLTHETLF